VIVCAGAALAVSPEARADLAGVARYTAWNLGFLNFMEPRLPGLFEGNIFTQVNGALWTLKIEVMFYLLLPLLGWLLHVAGNMRWWVLGGLYAAGEVWRLGMLAWGPVVFPDRIDWDLAVMLSRQFPGQIAFFVTGISLCLLREHINWRSALPVVGIAMLVAALLWTPAHALRPLGLGIFVVWLAVGIPHLFNAARFGDFSYGVYIVNFPIIQAFAAAGLFAISPWAAGAGAVAAIFLAAFLLWHLVERPALRRDSAYRRGRAAEADPPAAAQLPA
jgi:peptidoglycan/LPS O-acetylase OafA/YrhL